MDIKPLLKELKEFFEDADPLDDNLLRRYVARRTETMCLRDSGKRLAFVERIPFWDPPRLIREALVDWRNRHSETFIMNMNFMPDVYDDAPDVDPYDGGFDGGGSYCLRFHCIEDEDYEDEFHFDSEDEAFEVYRILTGKDEETPPHEGGVTFTLHPPYDAVSRDDGYDYMSIYYPKEG